MIQPTRDAFDQVRELLPKLSPAQKARLLHDVARDLDAFAPGIERTPDVCGGDACIVRTRIPVWLLEQARRMGSEDQEILDAKSKVGAGGIGCERATARGSSIR